jgi:hypothetical protein
MHHRGRRQVGEVKTPSVEILTGQEAPTELARDVEVAAPLGAPVDDDADLDCEHDRARGEKNSLARSDAQSRRYLSLAPCSLQTAPPRSYALSAMGTDCFDAALAGAPTRWLDVAAVIDVLQVSHAPERIAEYRDAMRRGERFPPVSVVRLGGRFFIADGHKRFSAYKEMGAERILVEVWSLRRWLRDQGGQLGRKTRAQVAILVRSPFDASARARGRRLFWDSVGHWRRIATSLAALRGARK